MFKIIIYDDNFIQYFKGNIQDLSFMQDEPIESTSLWDNDRKFLPGIFKHFEIITNNSECDDYIKLDETMMKRIAKYNKEKELQKIEDEIKEKEKQIKELDNKLQDKEKRWQKVKDYIANIYDLDLEEDDEDYYDYDD